MIYLFAFVIIVGLIGVALMMAREEGRAGERQAALQRSFDAAKERAHVEEVNRSLSIDELRDKLRSHHGQ